MTGKTCENRDAKGSQRVGITQNWNRSEVNVVNCDKTGKALQPKIGYPINKVNIETTDSDKKMSEDLTKELMAAQEINFAKVLAGNDKKMRDRAVKKLVKWLVIRSKGKKPFTEDNFKRIWSGLFYCMWMSDKFLVQEELAESISKLVHCFRNNGETALLFIKCFYKIMALEWPGIDQHRFDKFCMLVRRFLRQSLDYCRRIDWDQTFVKAICDIFEETVLNHDVPVGFLLHFVDIYPEELAKVSRGKLKMETAMTMFEPVVKLLSTSKDERTIKAVSLFFNHLIRQTDVGIEYEAKVEAWKQMGMPSDRPEELEIVMSEGSGEDDELDEMLADGPMDPRAGKVDAILPQIPVDFDAFISLIDKHLLSEKATAVGLRSLRAVREKFQALKKGAVPDNIVKPAILNEKTKRWHTMKCVRDLMEYTKKLYQEEENDLELTCDEIDSEEEEETPAAMNGKVSDDENKTAEQSEEKKKKKKKKKKRKALPEAVTKVAKPLKPKSPKETFIVEDVESDKLVVTPSKKRKALTAWQVHDLEADSEEYSKITVPKIIKLEKKVAGSSTVRESIADTPVTKASPQVKLTPSFWDKAKEKAAGKKRKSGGVMLPNPFYPDDPSQKSRRISFALERNEAQENDEYLEEVRNSPRIPFDASKKPVQSALKSGLSPSPINPFYRFKKFK